MGYEDFIQKYFKGEDSKNSRELFNERRGDRQHIKELTGFRALEKIKEKSENPEELLEKSIDIIVNSMEFPEEILVKIEFDDLYSNIKDDDLLKSTPFYVAPIEVHNKIKGQISVTNLVKKDLLPSEKNAIIEYGKVIGQGIEKIKKQQKIKYLCFNDGLTGMYNRNYFDQEVKRLDNSRQLPLSLIIADLNNLKPINDCFGYDEGDRLIKKAADIIKNSCRKGDLVARWGGDEYVVLLPKTDSKVCQKVVNRINENCQKEGKNFKYPLTLSVGCATKDLSEQLFDDTFSKAEDKMKNQKRIYKIKNNILR